MKLQYPTRLVLLITWSALVLDLTQATSNISQIIALGESQKGPIRTLNGKWKLDEAVAEMGENSINLQQFNTIDHDRQPQARTLINNDKEARTFNLLKRIWQKPKVSPLYLLDGTVCRFVNYQPVCTTLTTTGVLRGPTGGTSSGGGSSGGGGGSSGGGGGSSGGGSSGGSRGGSSGGGSGGSSGGGGGSSGGGGGSSGGGSSGGGGGGSGGGRPSSSGVMSSGSSVQFVSSRNNGQLAVIRPATSSLLDDDTNHDLNAEASNKLTDTTIVPINNVVAEQLQLSLQKPVNYLVRTRRRPMNLLSPFRRPSPPPLTLNKQENIL